MTAWIVSVCGVSLLTVLVDTIVPEGNTQKYVRTVIGIVLTFTMLLPIANLFKNISTESARFENAIETQQQFIDWLEEQKELARVQKVTSVVEQCNVDDFSVSAYKDGYVCVRVSCNKQSLTQLQSALSAIKCKILLIWSDSSG